MRVYNSLENHVFVKSEGCHSKTFTRQTVEVDIANGFNAGNKQDFTKLNLSIKKWTVTEKYSYIILCSKNKFIDSLSLMINENVSNETLNKYHKSNETTTDQHKIGESVSFQATLSKAM